MSQSQVQKSTRLPLSEQQALPDLSKYLEIFFSGCWVTVCDLILITSLFLGGGKSQYPQEAE